MEVFPVFAGEYLFDSCSPVQMLLTQETVTSVRHQHDFTELAYVLQGEGIHRVAEDKMQVAKGDLFAIPPGVSHVFQPLDLSGTQPLLILNCMLRPEAFKPPAELQMQAAPEEISRLTRLQEIKYWFGYQEKDRELALLFSRMQEIHNSASPEKRLQLYPLLSEVVSLILPYAAVPFAPQPQTPEDPLHDVILYMVSNFRQRISLKEISLRIAMSSRQFQRLFKLKTGKSYIQMLQEIRMKYSCALLMFTELGIQNIALEVGINDMKYFYRLFREYSGMTPANYRNQLHSHFLSPKEMMSCAEHSPS